MDAMTLTDHLTLPAAMAEVARLRAELAEMTRRRDEWSAKAEGYDEIRLALREKVGDPGPPHLSRLLWAGIAADHKKTVRDARAAWLAFVSATTTDEHKAAEAALDAALGTEERDDA